jgi:post-segregation antitoxin (ccd killing protein)
MAHFSVYLPDELRDRARDAGLNLSGLLRRAVITELRTQRETDDQEQEVATGT